MNRLTNVIIKPLKSFKYLKPLTIDYTIDGKQKTWSILSVHGGVSVFLYNTTRKVIILVKQFRPVIYLNKIPESERNGMIDTEKYPIDLGMTLELCAGIVDKNKSLKQIAAEEVHEECNYKIDPNSLEKVITYRSEVSRQGTKQTLFYTEITDDMKDANGPKEDNIDVVEMNIEEMRKYAAQEDCATTALLLFSINWFLLNKVKNFK